MNIVCFYEPIFFDNNPTDFSKDSQKLIQLWKKSWSSYGWNPTVLSLIDAQSHPRYKEIDLKNHSSNLYKHSVNEASYLELCYSRWFAYGANDGAWSDYDVMNYGFTPEDMQDLTKHDPVFFDEIGSCGFSTRNGHNLIIDGFIKTYQDDSIVSDILLLEQKHNQLREVNDMHINRRQNSPITFLNNLCQDNFKNDSWKSSKLVHYHNELWNSFQAHECKSRSDFIQKERPV